ncbi:sensor histidine kinase [Arthrobacter dokdonensis]|uniref:sensor histidine kinase n=1 Tax=Arthrobacter dokdonellae TaxID=2211210 RepID=UPI001F1F7EF3|nr:ATP-binding protein [Arthrobacter dokdonellae]
MLASAESFASTPIVASQIGTPQASLVLAPDMERTRSLSNASVVAIADSGGTVIASSDPTTVGTHTDFVAAKALQGRAWTGDIASGGEQSIVANVPVLRDDGSVAGIIVVAEEYPPVGTELEAAVPGLLLFLGIGAGLGVLGSWVLSGLVRRGTRGLEPHEIAELADHREALLYSIREGVIGVGADGKVTVLNKSAMELLNLPPESAGARILDLPVGNQIRSSLLETTDNAETALVTDTRILVLNRRAVVSRGRYMGTVTTLRDRTELAELRSQLAMNQSITETMRAQTHEFFNHLHTVSGLVQLGEFNEVRQFIGTLTRRSAEITQDISQRIEDPTVTALLVAKTSLARESGIALQLSEDSGVGPLGPSLAADVITVLGNLIDNAVDATAGLSDIAIAVGLHDNGTMITLSVSDPGPGIPEDLEQRIFSRGFTTKPPVSAGRGVGLALVRLVCSQRGGEVTVRTDNGATFEATLPYPPGDRS